MVFYKLKSYSFQKNPKNKKEEERGTLPVGVLVNFPPAFAPLYIKVL